MDNEPIDAALIFENSARNGNLLEVLQRNVGICLGGNISDTVHNLLDSIIDESDSELGERLNHLEDILLDPKTDWDSIRKDRNYESNQKCMDLHIAYSKLIYSFDEKRESVKDYNQLRMSPNQQSKEILPYYLIQILFTENLVKFLKDYKKSFAKPNYFKEGIPYKIQEIQMAAQYLEFMASKSMLKIALDREYLTIADINNTRLDESTLKLEKAILTYYLRNQKIHPKTRIEHNVILLGKIKELMITTYLLHEPIPKGYIQDFLLELNKFTNRVKRGAHTPPGFRKPISTIENVEDLLSTLLINTMYADRKQELRKYMDQISVSYQKLTDKSGAVYKRKY